MLFELARVHLLTVAAIIAQKHENLLLNKLSGLHSRYTGDIMHSYLNAQFITGRPFDFP
jgi:hypothetical protein